LLRTPVEGSDAPHFRTFTRFSAAFALIADATLATLGGDLKRREKISGRLADALAWLYLGSTALKRFHDEGGPERHAAVLDWSCKYAAWQVQEALIGVLENLPNRVAAALLSRLIFPWGRPVARPSDALGAQVVDGLLNDGALRRYLSRDVYQPTQTDRGLGRLEAALQSVVAADSITQKLRQAVRNGTVSRDPVESLAVRAKQACLINDQEFQLLTEAEASRDAAISVDVFEPEIYHDLKG
ncbi:MAG: DUF1974 domain-containing protein, partial [Alphaproteobacteria bacterium]|nr:DUF1974 domain-containing protein [Alphaproteobacteria bacterium]